MARTFREILGEISRTLAQSSAEAAVYDHPSGKGEQREDLVRKALRERVGSDFGVSKAEVVDSDGNSAAEYDVAIYDESASSSLHVTDARRIVRAESLAILVEVKSRLDAGRCSEARDGLTKALALRRYYQPTPWMLQVPPEKRGPIHEGLPCGDPFQDVPSVVTAIFAYSGPGEDVARKYMEDGAIDVVVVLGQYTLAHKSRGAGHAARSFTVETIAQGDDAFAGFVCVVEDALHAFRFARTWVLPDARRYLAAQGAET
jgi:hypothetical protein